MGTSTIFLPLHLMLCVLYAHIKKLAATTSFTCLFGPTRFVLCSQVYWPGHVHFIHWITGQWLVSDFQFSVLCSCGPIKVSWEHCTSESSFLLLELDLLHNNV